MTVMTADGEGGTLVRVYLPIRTRSMLTSCQDYASLDLPDVTQRSSNDVEHPTPDWPARCKQIVSDRLLLSRRLILMKHALPDRARG